MIDPLAAVASAIATGSPAAIAAVFAAGALSSFGPCVAPRYLAIAGYSTGARRPVNATLSFVVGLVLAYALIGLAAGWLGSMRSLAGSIDAGMGVVLVVAGIVMIWRAEPQTPHLCAHEPGRPLPQSAPFLLGAASALVVSPCCTPILAAIVATASALGRPVAGAGLLACFALGHAVPLLVTGSLGAVVRRLHLPGALAQCPAIIGGALLVGLGAFYGTLA
jgi:thiol:disulfide interchange protein DsbD